MEAVFNMRRKVKSIGELPPNIMLNLFDALIKPILIYGSDVWEIKSKLWGEADKIFLRYIQCILRVKATTSNIMTTGECGRFPPSTACQIAVLCFTNRLHHMSNDKLVKKVYCVLMETQWSRFYNMGNRCVEAGKRPRPGYKWCSEKNLQLIVSMLYKVIILRLGLQTYMISNPIQS